jgi:TRAP-type C4-dicarboxylate transport system permease small subunit
MSSNQIDYKAVGKQVEEEVLKQKRAVRVVFFVVSLLMVLIFGIVGWGMYSTVLDTISPEYLAAR